MLDLVLTETVEPYSFDILYADPPWWYNGGRRKDHRFRGGARGHYPVLKTEQICQMTPYGVPVRDLCGKNAALLLWVTWPNLPEAFKVMAAWGFTYKTLGFIWVKTNKCQDTPFFGVGSYSASNSEPCLLGIRGSMGTGVTGKHRSVTKPSQVVCAPEYDFEGELVVSRIGEHSAKPPIVRERIEQLFGQRPRLELFAREEAPGWKAWGEAVDPMHRYDVPGKSDVILPARGNGCKGKAGNESLTLISV